VSRLPEYSKLTGQTYSFPSILCISIHVYLRSHILRKAKSLKAGNILSYQQTQMLNPSECSSILNRTFSPYCKHFSNSGYSFLRTYSPTPCSHQHVILMRQQCDLIGLHGFHGALNMLCDFFRTNSIFHGNIHTSSESRLMGCIDRSKDNWGKKEKKFAMLDYYRALFLPNI
jgi:hypothetical protein